jgi:hypothetical protein
MSTKELEAVAAEINAIKRSGFLWKQGENNKAFKKRWCVLTGSTLNYFHEQSDEKPAGAIDLQQCFEVTEKATTDQQFSFELKTPGRVYVLAAASQTDMDGWCVGGVARLSQR